MNRESAYSLIGHYAGYQRNKEVADIVLNVLEHTSRPMTAREIFQYVKANSIYHIYECEVKRILNNLYFNGYNDGVVEKIVVQDTIPTIVKDTTYRDDVRIDKNGSYVFSNKMVLPDGTTIKGDFSTYFSALGAPTSSWVDVPMQIYVKRNYWKLK
jgi:hypothetical protein